NHRVRKVNTAGVITTVAGNGTIGFQGDGGPAIDAQITYPSGVAIDQLGNVFIADASNNRVRVVSDGIIRTAAGTGMYGSCGAGGPAESAQLAYPNNITVDRFGNLFIADTENQRIRQVTPGGIINTVAGNGRYGWGGDGGPAWAAELALPYGVAVEGTNTLFI